MSRDGGRSGSGAMIVGFCNGNRIVRVSPDRVGGGHNRWQAAKMGGGQQKWVGGSKNGWGAAKMGGGKLKWVFSGTYSF